MIPGCICRISCCSMWWIVVQGCGRAWVSGSKSLAFSNILCYNPPTYLNLPRQFRAAFTLTESPASTCDFIMIRSVKLNIWLYPRHYFQYTSATTNRNIHNSGMTWKDHLRVWGALTKLWSKCVKEWTAPMGFWGCYEQIRWHVTAVAF